jgi:hypothetical protein
MRTLSSEVSAGRLASSSEAKTASSWATKAWSSASAAGTFWQAVRARAKTAGIKKRMFIRVVFIKIGD